MRYGLQLGEVTSPVEPGPINAAMLEESVAEFERRYARLYGEGSGFREAGIHGITLRVRGVGVLNVEPQFESLRAADREDPVSALLAMRPVCLDGRKGFVETPVYDYRLLRSGHCITGPAIIQVPTTSVVVPAGMIGDIDDFGNLRIQTRTNVIAMHSAEVSERSAA